MSTPAERKVQRTVNSFADRVQRGEPVVIVRRWLIQAVRVELRNRMKKRGRP